MLLLKGSGGQFDRGLYREHHIIRENNLYSKVVSLLIY